jgi:hypothetical protein
MKKENKNKKANGEKEEKFPGYPHYSGEEDIYARDLEESDLDPEDPSGLKPPNEDPGTMNEKNFEDAVTGEDLDIPGNEQDEENYGDGPGDEENNYYSLGGDNHENLEENQGK